MIYLNFSYIEIRLKQLQLIIFSVQSAMKCVFRIFFWNLKYVVWTYLHVWMEFGQFGVSTSQVALLNWIVVHADVHVLKFTILCNKLFYFEIY